MLRTTSLDGVKGGPSWTFSDFLPTMKENLHFHSAGPPVGAHGVSVSVFSSSSEFQSKQMVFWVLEPVLFRSDDLYIVSVLSLYSSKQAYKVCAT